MGVSPRFFEMSRLMTFLLLLASIVVQLNFVCAADYARKPRSPSPGHHFWSPSPGHGAMSPMSWSPSPVRKKLEYQIISKPSPEHQYPEHQYPEHQYPEHGALSPVSWSPSPGHHLFSPYPGHASLNPGHLTPAWYDRHRKQYYCSRGGNSFWQKSPCPIGF